MPAVETTQLVAAAEAIAQAKHLLITAGAGMGVDSGLSTFRGKGGFWNLYPPYRHLRLDYMQLATPEVFLRDPELAWGFYGQRVTQYRETKPHAGFEILKQWAAAKQSSFVFTSNVDGQFQKSGFDAERVVEIHGSIFLAQCTKVCSRGIWSVAELDVEVETTTMRAVPPLPSCPRCGGGARPNVILFGDGESLTSARLKQSRRFWDWEQSVRGSALVVVELGAGVGIPSVRNKGEQLVRDLGAKLIRINPTHTDGPEGSVVLRCGALEGLRRLDEALVSLELV
jgi:NAD-dependent SIR2 family protein deacetylase